MRSRAIACALISASSWLVACGTDAANSTNPSQDGGAGTTQTGSGGGGGGQGGGGVSGGGNGGSALGGNGGSSGTAGTNVGGAGTGGTPTVDAGSLCDGKAKKSLPYNIMSDYRAVTVIGTENTFTINPNPDCVTAYPSPEGGADAASADSADETQTLALDDPDAGDATATDVSVSDASTSDAAVSDAGVVDAGPPPPACYEFHYLPDGCEAATCWAGVIFQPGAVLPPADAAVETSTGLCIASGATMVEFMARANRDGARVKFGSIRAGVDQTEFWLNITTQWAKYSVAIPANEPYNESADTSGGVWNGFSVVVEPQDHVGGTIISVKDMTWK